MKNYYLFVVFGFTKKRNHLYMIPFLYVWFNYGKEIIATIKLATYIIGSYVFKKFKIKM